MFRGLHVRGALSKAFLSGLGLRQLKGPVLRCALHNEFWCVVTLCTLLARFSCEVRLYAARVKSMLRCAFYPRHVLIVRNTGIHAPACGLMSRRESLTVVTPCLCAHRG